MTTIINASNTTGLTLTSDLTGTLSLQSAGTAVANISSTGFSTPNNINVPNTFDFKNRIINGDMRIDQRNAGASQSWGSTTVAGNYYGYSVDRWQIQSYTTTAGSGIAFTTQQNAGSVTPPVGFTNYLGATVTTPQSSLSATTVCRFYHRIEGVNIADLAWGTSNAKTITLSAWVRSSLTGTFGGTLVNGAGNRCYVFSYSIPVANTWTQISLTIPGDTTGTWLTTNGIGIAISFSIGSNSASLGATGSWGSTEYYGATGQTNVVSTNGATFYLTGVQLEVGLQATSFDYRDYGRELILCQRYYQISYDGGIKPGSAVLNENAVQQDWGTNVSGGIASSVFALPVNMRTAPTATVYDIAGNSGKVTGLDAGANTTNNLSYNSVSPRENRFYIRVYQFSYYGMSYMYTLSAEL